MDALSTLFHILKVIWVTMKQFIFVAGIVYLSFGFIFALYAYSHELRVLTCTDPTTPHGITMGSRSYRNPDPKRCTRRGFALESIAGIPVLTALGPVILAARYFNNID